MATEIAQSQVPVTPRKLWFGFAASAFAWTAIGILEVIVAWRTCSSFGHGTGVTGHTDARVLSFALAIAVLALSLSAGFMSYRNWRRLSHRTDVLRAEGQERREFMALCGMFITLTLGMGMIWLAIGPLIVVACQRAK
jgi:hypothetical protein